MTPANVAAVLAAMKIMAREPERREALWRNSRRMKEGLDSLGFDTGACETPIIPVHCGDGLRALKTGMRLHEEGVFVNPVVPPAVPPNGALRPRQPHGDPYRRADLLRPRKVPESRQGTRDHLNRRRVRRVPGARGRWTVISGTLRRDILFIVR